MFTPSHERPDEKHAGGLPRATARRSKSLFCNILPVTPFDAGIWTLPRRFPHSKLFRINTLAKEIRKKLNKTSLDVDSARQLVFCATNKENVAGCGEAEFVRTPARSIAGWLRAEC